MSASRRSILAAAGGSIAAFDIARATGVAASTEAGPTVDVAREVAGLIRLSEESNAALMRGDIDRYSGLLSFSDDFTLMTPFGGTSRYASALPPETLEAMRRFFRNGTLAVEVVQAYGSSDMVVLALIERAHVEVGGLPAQDWSLRVTLVYRRDGSVWRLAHRHADPLAGAISLQQSAALARGAAP